MWEQLVQVQAQLEAAAATLREGQATYGSVDLGLAAGDVKHAAFLVGAFLGRVPPPVPPVPAPGPDPEPTVVHPGHPGHPGSGRLT